MPTGVRMPVDSMSVIVTNRGSLDSDISSGSGGVTKNLYLDSVYYGCVYIILQQISGAIAEVYDNLHIQIAYLQYLTGRIVIQQ